LFSDQTEGLVSLTHYLEGSTLEEELIVELDTGRRRLHLQNMSILSTRLYESGVVWGDFAPRNILVSEVANGHFLYRLVDFEKLQFLDAPVPDAVRAEHCRGAICAEEFGAVCSSDEVVELFAPYFRPREWDTESVSPLSMASPKRQVLDVLKGRGLGANALQVGIYNRTEQEMLAVRFPLVDSTGIRIRPVDPCYRIDHYLGSSYDRMTVEVLLAAHRHGNLCQAVELLSRLVDLAELGILLPEYSNSIEITRIKPADYRQRTAVRFLADSIERLYFECERHGDLAASLRRQKIVTHRFAEVYCSTKETYRPSRLSDVLLSEVQKLISDAVAERHIDLVALSGSLARREATFGSDVELFIMGRDSRKIEQDVHNALKCELASDLDMYALTTPHDVTSFLQELPDYFIDLNNAKPVWAAPDKWQAFRDAVLAATSQQSFFRAVLARRGPIYVRSQFIAAPDSTSVKMVLNGWSMLESICELLEAGYSCFSVGDRSLKYELLYMKSVGEVELYLGGAAPAFTRENFYTVLRAMERYDTAYAEVTRRVGTSPDLLVRDELFLSTIGPDAIGFQPIHNPRSSYQASESLGTPESAHETIEESGAAFDRNTAQCVVNLSAGGVPSDGSLGLYWREFPPIDQPAGTEQLFDGTHSPLQLAVNSIVDSLRAIGCLG
jgi:predicted nucleotidyltransferase